MLQSLPCRGLGSQTAPEQVTSHPLAAPSLPPSLWHGLGNFEIWGILKSPCSQTPCVCCPGELGREVLCGNHLLILISALPLWAREPPSLSSGGIGLNTAYSTGSLNLLPRFWARRHRGGHQVGTWGCGWDGWGRDTGMCSWEIWISL